MAHFYKSKPIKKTKSFWVESSYSLESVLLWNSSLFWKNSYLLELVIILVILRMASFWELVIL